MKNLGGENFTAWIGPHICGRCYEVSEDIYHEVISLYPLSASKTIEDTFSLDLARALSDELTVHGVNVQTSQVCTVESMDHFSYRRDGITGRTLGVIAL